MTLQNLPDEELNRRLCELVDFDTSLMPDFTTSLDAVASVEAGLTDEQWVIYTERKLPMQAKNMPRPSCCLIGASARQRTIALIQTLSHDRD